MRVYRERLGVPAWWWLAAAVCILTMGSIVWGGFSIWIGVAVYAGLGALIAAMFLNWGGVNIEVSLGELRVGSRSLPLAQTGSVAALDAAQTRELRGPRADPAAYLLIRPYLPKAVYIEVAGRPASAPYWLIGTRRPAELAAAIERARSSAGQVPPVR